MELYIGYVDQGSVRVEGVGGLTVTWWWAVVARTSDRKFHPLTDFAKREMVVTDSRDH